MSDQNRDLHQVLNEFHEVLEASKDLGEHERQHLASALREIREVLGSEGGGSSEPESLIERLRAGLEALEDRHPRLTAVVGRVADSLADLGI